MRTQRPQKDFPLFAVKGWVLLFALFACTPQSARQATMSTDGVATYEWERLVETAAFPASYNFPVHVSEDGVFVALHPKGTWRSRDGAEWTSSPLPAAVLNSAYMNYVFHDGGAWALGRHIGSYEKFEIDPLILRTRDYSTWETVGRSETFPHVVFSASTSFQGALWILGGYDGRSDSGSVWRSTNGLDWIKAVDVAPWGARSGAKAIVFKGRIFLIGGGVLDGATANDVWSSADGITWSLETSMIAPEAPVGFTPIVFDDQLWLVGANRSGAFKSEMLVSDDGKTWRPAAAPWSPRGGVAAWVHGQFLYMTGGKYSVEHLGETRFIYSNDVWRMRRK